MQIRTRLTLQFLFIEAAILLVAVVYMYLQYKNQLENEFFSNLRSKAYLTAAAAVGRLEKQATTEIISPSNRYTGTRVASENIAIFDPENRLVYTFQPFEFEISLQTLNAVRQRGELRFSIGSTQALGVQFSSPTGKMYVLVAEGDFEDEKLAEMAQRLLLIFIILLTAGAAIGWVFAGQALAPVRNIMNQMDAMAPANLSHRLSVHKQHDELGRLTATFNQLLERIEKAFVSQKMFISNLSHELKNPLTIIITQLEIALNKPRSAEDYQKTMLSVLDDARQLNEVAEKLLQLAKISAGSAALESTSIRLDELIWQVKSTVQKSMPESKILFELSDLPDDENRLHLQGNEPLLRAALFNLLENGCKFSPDHQVKIRLFFDFPSIMSLEISDHGPGIAPAELQHIFEPFFRGSNVGGIRGSGVGLSLVKSVMDLHGAEISVRNQATGGLVFLIHFPSIASAKL